MNAGVDGREGFAAFLLRARRAGIGDRRLIEAIEALPRAAFVDEQWHAVLWANRTLPIDCGEAIEPIDLQARMIAALDLHPGDRVLEIGTGSGYTAALMARLEARVATMERWKTLANAARRRFDGIGIVNVAVRHADAAKGLPGEGPFDKIVSWAAFDGMPRGFVDQLASGGTMIAPIGPGDGPQPLAKLVKVGSRFEREDIGTVRFQPLLAGVAAVL